MYVLTKLTAFVPCPPRGGKGHIDATEVARGEEPRAVLREFFAHLFAELPAQDVDDIFADTLFDFAVLLQHAKKREAAARFGTDDLVLTRVDGAHAATGPHDSDPPDGDDTPLADPDDDDVGDLSNREWTDVDEPFEAFPEPE